MKKTAIIITTISIIIASVFLLQNRNNPSPVNDKPTVKIGVSLPLTGFAAYVGEPASHAAQMAFDKWNTKGTKYNYKLIIEDDRLSVKDTATAANKLVNLDKVNAAITMWGIAAPIFRELASKSNIPHITCSWGSWADGGNTFNNTTSAQELSNKMIKLFNLRGVKKVGFVSQLSKSDEEMKEIFVETFKNNNIEVAWTEAFQMGSKDFRTFWAKTAQKPVDIIVILMVPEDFYAFLKQKREAGNKMDFTTVDYFSSMDKTLIEGKMYISSSIGNKDFEEKINQRVRAGLGDCLANIYDNVDMMIYAFENAKMENGKIPTTEAVTEVLRNLKGYDGVVGKLTTNKDGHINSPAFIREIKNNNSVVIEE